MTASLVDWRGHGLRVTHSVTQYDEAKVRRGASDEDLVRLHFAMRGDYSVRYPGLDRSYELVGGHHNILYSRPFDLEFINKTPLLETFGVHVPVEQFVTYVDGSNDLLSRFCEQLTNAQHAILSERWAPITPAIESTIRQMLECGYSGALKDLFLLSKSIELLVLSVEASSQAKTAAHPKNRAERDKVAAARDFVNTRLTAPPTLSEVARSVGLNEYKLKIGFKEMFGTTVFAYLAEQRLALARRYLLDTEKSAAEIAFDLGYATPQHFSNAFKRRFGVAPNSIRKNPG